MYSTIRYFAVQYYMMQYNTGHHCTIWPNKTHCYKMNTVQYDPLYVLYWYQMTNMFHNGTKGTNDPLLQKIANDPLYVSYW